eukprot:m.38879 g.38879  ORF g.38879 m.38879 type:complete len:142 (-) comp9488_c0_seq1:1230-1655(-)
MAGVAFRCSCGCLRAVPSLYWCRHCVTLRCAYCVSQEVDAFFCPNCLDELMPTTEAKLNKNKCSTGCMNCPLCSTNLSFVSAEGGGYMACGYCQWTSETIDLTGTRAEIIEKVKKNLEETPESAKTKKPNGSLPAKGKRRK